MSFVIGPEGIPRYQLSVHIARLRIEINTGMGSRVSTAKSAREKYGRFGCTAKNKRELLGQLMILRDRVDRGEVDLDGPTDSNLDTQDP